MTTPTPSSVFCTKCKTEKGIFTCTGCSQAFCIEHTSVHRQDVVKRLYDVEELRDRVQKRLKDESNEPSPDAKTLHEELTKKIDQWEQESIGKIQRAAAEARQDVNKYTLGHFNSKSAQLEQLSSELQQARRQQDFLETDLQAWKKRLDRLQDELTNPPMVNISEDCGKSISTLRVNVFDGQEFFERSSGNADFEDDGKVVYIKGNKDIYTDVRGKYEYTSGQHTIVMKVEELTGWILFGIISKITPLNIHSYAAPTCYGWYNGNSFVYAAGQCIGGEGINVLQDDTIQLVIDCSNRLIRVSNERTGQKLELAVDVQKCPFPWQLHLNLNERPTRIRIVSTTISR